METGVVIIQEPVFTKTNVEEATAGVILNHLSMEVVDKVTLSTVVDGEITSRDCRNDNIPREAEVVNGPGHKESEESERGKGEAMKTVLVVEDSKIVKEKACETEKEKEDDITQKSEEVSVEKPVIEEDQTETKQLPEQEEEIVNISKVLIDTTPVKSDEVDIEKSLNSARKEIPIKNNEAKEEKDSRTVETSVNGTESDHNGTVSVEEISRNGENILNETVPEEETVTVHDVETTKRVFLEAERDAETSLNAKEKDETENVKTVIEEPEIVKTEETTLQESESIKENVEPVEAIKNSILKDLETKEDTESSLDLKEETEKVKTEPCSSEIKDESHGREESVEVISKETVQEESSEEKHGNLLDVPSTESVKYQDNEHETALVADTEIRDKFEEIPSDLALKVDKEELDQVDGTLTVEEQRGLDSNKLEAEQSGQNRTVEKLVAHPDVESVEMMQKPSIESPSETVVTTEPHSSLPSSGPPSSSQKQEQGTVSETEKIRDEKVEKAEPIGDMSNKGLQTAETTNLSLPPEVSKSESFELVSEFEEQKPKEAREILERDITQEPEEVQETPMVIEIPTIQGEDIESKASNDTEKHEHVVVRDIPQIETLVTEAEPVNTSAVQESAILKDLETEEDAQKSVDLKEDKEQVETETVKKTVISTDEVRSIDVQAEEFSSEIKDESHRKEDSVEVKSKETTQEESSDKYEKLLDVPSGESEDYQDKKPETDLEKFKEIPSNLVLKVDKDPEAEQTDRNRTDETEESPVEKLDALESPSEVLEETSKTFDEKIKVKPQEEEVTQHQEGPEEGSYGLETKEEMVSVPESIELGEKSRNVVDLTPLQDESCLPNEQEKETKLHKEHIEKHEPTNEEVIEVSSATASKELEVETIVEAEKVENVRENEQEQAAEKIQKSLETVEITEPHSSLPSSSGEQEHETVSKKIEDEKVEEEEPMVQILSEDDATRSHETGETPVFQEEHTRDIEPSLTEKCSLDQTQPEKQVKDEQEKVIETEKGETKSNEPKDDKHVGFPTSLKFSEESGDDTLTAEAKKGDEETTVRDLPQGETIVIETEAADISTVQETVVEDTGIVKNEETTVHEPASLKENAEAIKTSDDAEKISREVTVDKEKEEDITQKTQEVQESPTVIETPKIQGENSEPKDSKDTEEHEYILMRDTPQTKAETLDTSTIQEAAILKTLETTINPEAVHSTIGGEEESQETKEEAEPSLDLKEDKEQDETEPVKTVVLSDEVVQESATVVETPTVQGASLELKEEVDQSSKDTEEDKHVLVRDIPQVETLVTEAEAVDTSTVQEAAILKTMETKEDMKENKEQEETETVKTVISSDEVRPSDQVDVQAEESGEHCSLEIKDESQGREESVEVKPKEIVQEENTEDKHEDLLDELSGETEKFQDNEPETDHLVAKRESRDEFEDISRDILLKVDKEENSDEKNKNLLDEKKKVDQVDGTQGVEEQRGLDSNEQIDRNRTGETEESPVEKLVVVKGDETTDDQALLDVETVEKIQNPSLEPPSEESSRKIDEKIEEKPEQVTQHQEGQEEGSHGLETKEEIISEPDSSDLGVKSQQEESCLPNEQIEKHERRTEESVEVKPREIVQDESTQEKHKNLLDESEKFQDNEPETVLVADTENTEKFEEIPSDLVLKVDKEELKDDNGRVGQVDDKIQVMEEQIGLDSNEPEPEKIDRNRTGETEESAFEKLVAVKDDDTTHDQDLLDVETVEKVRNQSLDCPSEESEEISKNVVENIEEIEHQEEGSHGLGTKEEAVSEPESSDLGVKSQEEGKHEPRNDIDQQSHVEEKSDEAMLVSAATTSEDQEGETDVKTEDIKVNEEEQVAEKIKKSPETVETVDTKSVKFIEDDTEESLNSTREEIQIKTSDKENVPIDEVNVTVPVEEISRDIVNETAPEDDAEKISHEVTGDREKEEDITQKQEEVQETPKVIEIPKIKGEDTESKDSKDTEEHEHVVVRDMPQVETLVTEPESADTSIVQESAILKTKIDEPEAVHSEIDGEDEGQETKADTEPSLDPKAEDIETMKTDISSDKVRYSDVKTTETVQEESSVEKHENLLDDKTKADQFDGTQTMEEQRGLDLNDPEAEKIDRNRTDETEESAIVEAEETRNDQALPDVESVEKMQKACLDSPCEVSEETSVTVDEKIEEKPKDEEVTQHQESQKEVSYGLEPVEKHDSSEAPKLEESKEDKSQEVSETFGAIEATGDHTLAIETSEADQTPSFVSELEDKIPKQIEEIHVEETKEAHKLQVAVADQSLPEEYGNFAEAEKIEDEKVKETETMGDTSEKDTEISEPKEPSLPLEPSRSDGIESSVLVSEFEEQKSKQNELSKAVETKETTVAQEEQTRDIGTSLTEKGSTDQTQPGEQVNEECSRDEHVDSSEKSENEITLIAETKKEEFENLEVPKLEESKEDKSQEVSEAIETIEATGDRALAIDHTPSFVSELEDKIPKQIEEIHEEETTEAHKLQEKEEESHVPRESFSEGPVSMLASRVADQVTVQEGDTRESEGETEPKESSEAERTELTSDIQVETSTKVTKVEDEDTKHTDTEVAEHGDESSSTLPVVEILRGLQTTLENERAINDSASTEENTITEPAEQVQKTGNAEAEAENDLHSIKAEQETMEKHLVTDISEPVTNEKHDKKAADEAIASNIIEENKLQQDESGETETVQEENGIAGKSVPIEELNLKEEAKIQDCISREFEVNVEEKSQIEETSEIAESEPEQHVNASIAEKISLEEEDFETSKKEETVKEEDQVVDIKEVKEINKVATSEKQITVPQSGAEKESNEEPQAPKGQREEVIADKFLTEEALGDEFQERRNAEAISDRDLSVGKPSELIQSHQSPSPPLEDKVDNAGYEVKKTQEEKNEETVDTLITKEETGLVEEKPDSVKTELEDGIKQGVSIEEKNNASKKTDRDAAEEIYQEKSKQTDTVKEETKEEKNIDNAAEKTQSVTREIESFSSLSKTQDKSKQKDEVSKLENLNIAEESKELFSEVKESEPSPVKEAARKSLSDLIQNVKGTNKNEDTKPHHFEEEHPKTEEEEDENEDGDEHKDDKTSPDSSMVMVEAKDTVQVIKTHHKKSQGILSGVGSKVKHSISKVKKALTGKSSHTTKPSSPK